MISKLAPSPPVSQTHPKGATPVDLIVDKTGRFNKLQPAFQKQLMRLANDFYKMHHTPLILTDTLRSNAEQAQAHLEKPYLALPAGHPNAMHPRGLAVDVDQNQARMIPPEMLTKNNLHLPALSKGEDWHIEPKFMSFGGSSSSSHKSFSRSKPQGSSEIGPGDRFAQRNSQLKEKTQLFESLSLVKQQGLAKGGTPDDRRRLHQAAMEIESIFLEQLMGQMRRAMVDPLSPSPQKLRGYLSLADQQLARSLAAGGGLGLASKILENLAPLESHSHKESRHEGNPSLLGRTDNPTGNLPVSETS